MIFLDESGDDGSKENSSQMFFVVSLVSSDEATLKEDYLNIKNKLNINKKDYKWNTLKRDQKARFYEICRNLKYKIVINYINKNNYINFEKMYYELALFSFKNIKKDELVLYTGKHLAKMFDKVRRFYKKDNIKLSFRISQGEELYGVAMADLWAGYVNYQLKNGQDLPNNKNIKINEYLK